MGSGVPKGWVLIVFIKDIDLVCDFIKLMNKFADNTKATNTILTDKDVENLQECLNMLVIWGMEFNVTNCKVMKWGGTIPV